MLISNNKKFSNKIEEKIRISSPIISSPFLFADSFSSFNSESYWNLFRNDPIRILQPLLVREGIFSLWSLQEECSLIISGDQEEAVARIQILRNERHRGRRREIFWYSHYNVRSRREEEGHLSSQYSTVQYSTVHYNVRRRRVICHLRMQSAGSCWSRVSLNCK